MRAALALLMLAASLLTTSCAVTRQALSLEAATCSVRMEPEVVNIACGEPG